MDYTKLDAPLAAAVERSTGARGRSLVIFVSVTAPPDPGGHALLRDLGAGPPPPPPSLVTVTASAAEVAALSQQRWVGALRLSHRLRPT